MRLRRLPAAAVLLGAAALPVFSACASTANISDVYMALDGDGNRPRKEFTTDAREIHCIIEGGFGRTDVTVEGHIRMVSIYSVEERKFVDSDQYVAYAEFAPEPTPGSGRPTKLDIALVPINDKGEPDDSAPFFAGSYICEVRLDGELVRSVEFNVKFAECPPVLIVPGSSCLGFYEPDDRCRRFGANSSEDTECTCTDQGAWNCPK
ncbi:MAG: hypothetical protein KIT84_39445 [Labilithrix sp.]|nr:hypothetical protein [Labilithrix sp.]MCW5817138.1 hypothetical protein [Labilithrix sp.]